ncbi:MAG: thioredoxin [Lautropia sp.]
MADSAGPGRTVTPIPFAGDLGAAGARARAAGGPAPLHLILFSATGCPFCETVRAQHLRHLVGTSHDRHPLLVSEVLIDRDDPLTGFDGRPTTAKAFARARGFRFAPTVAVFDVDGRRLGKPIVGALLEDFYGAYLDQLLDEAAAAARAAADR